MAKFDVYPIPGASGYLLDCQADLLSQLNTRLVVPLLPLDQAPTSATRLNPCFDINGEAFAMVTQFAAAVPVAELQAPIASLADHDYAISNALDMLITGY
jgi:toxin CcdB